MICHRTKNCRVGLLRDRRGFSLTELVVVMGIFLTIMLITSASFNRIVSQSSQQSKSLETQIEGMVGLEVLRADVSQVGFGLSWTFQNTPDPTVYQELVVSDTEPANFWPSGLKAMSFNDAATPSGNPPRAIQSGNTTFNKDSANVGAKYLVLKGTNLASNDAAKKWTTVAFSNGVKSIRTWNNAKWDFADTDRVVVVRNTLITTPPTRQLMVTSTGKFFDTFSNYSSLTQPHIDGDTFEVYGVSATQDLRMPFNRADYYIATSPDMPAGCAPHTGVLFKANIDHSDGKFNPKIPLLDCVADMQVVYGLDTGDDGSIDLHTVTPPATAADIRNQLREIRVYILAQDGKKDRLYKYPSKFVDVGERFDGVNIMGRAFDLETLIGSGWDNYRWKVYTIVVSPKNLIQ